MKNKTQNIILIVLIFILIGGPLVLSHGEFGGSDDQGTQQITKNDPGYKVWAKPLWTPPSGEIETLLFTLQGSLGTGIITYIFGYQRGKNKQKKQAETAAKTSAKKQTA
ncbi:energy-coupling factor ABC transporter substrate-binding protein [Companilactobacillus versmoldensis]|uniref:Cobalt transport protein CbiN n=1 Tax=Companilactobacillus versmoldensis DSM 14857 = KCTC 3814 TaxID=1423815 RepID=A0A0R1SGE6_9LACO|nr:energy-coupling factor ABC transporter substrate-binding protein [Companilactobacillus versmoldensis]KRL68224.1 cobalt transport protein CbiN [Companilactobacillus versmoldensis DSM 14857 = KCTC 3814]